MTNHLNSIQQACTNLSSDSELVLGEIYGLRQWRVRELMDGSPYLSGHRGFQWNPTGPNEASCNITERSSFYSLSLLSGCSEDNLYYELRRFLADKSTNHPTADKATIYISVRGQGVSLCTRMVRINLRELLAGFRPWEIKSESGVYQIDDITSEAGSRISFEIDFIEPVPAHEITDPSCTCGFYAYTDEKALAFNSNTYGEHVFGIVKAWGHVTIGTKGFRSQYAEIVGLTPELKHCGNYPFGSSIGPDWYPTRSSIVDEIHPKTRYKTVEDMLQHYQRLAEMVS